MGCSSCASGTQANGKPSGCGSNGGCSTGGCNRMNVYDWLSDLPFSAQQDSFKIVEVSFKNGSRKGYFRNTNNIDCHTGDLVVVEVPTGGHDIGQISLSGELVRLQMRKKISLKNPTSNGCLGCLPKKTWKYGKKPENKSFLPCCWQGLLQGNWGST